MLHPYFGSVGPEYYVSVMSFVNKDNLEPGCSILLHNKVMSVVGILDDDTDPMVSKLSFFCSRLVVLCDWM